MKTTLLLALLVVLLVPVQARADEARDTRGLIVNGAIMTAIGTVALIVGGALYGHAQTEWARQDRGECCISTDSNIVAESAGIGLLALGAAHMLAGIPTVAVGLHRRHTATRSPISLAASPTRDGATATVTLRF